MGTIPAVDAAVTAAPVARRAATPPGSVRDLGMKVAALFLALAIWFWPVPQGLTAQAWHLFALFAASIFAVVVGAFPILTSAMLALAASVLTGTLSPASAYAGFSNGTILLIVVAFLVARAVITCGLGQRIGYWAVSLFGRSTLGLGYSVFIVDAIIAPAFPSNTARSGVIYPLVFSLTEAVGARPDEPGRRRAGAFLMFSGMASLSLSSALWLTAMAGNPLGTEIARNFGIQIGFGSWLVAASLPTLAAMLLLPLFLYRTIRPEVTTTPDAPAAARKALAEMGPLVRSERIVAATFAGMVTLWGAASTLGIDSTAVALLGLGVLLSTGVLGGADIAKEGDVLATYLWFAALFTLSAQLNELGFMTFVGQRLSDGMSGMPWMWACLILLVAYILLHYLFVSQTAHVLALFGVFLDVGVKLGAPAAPLALMLLFASNFFSAISPQGSSANLLFVGSGYLSQGELYRLGALTTAFNLAVYLLIGGPWLALILS
jgi:DASS family divalent anion:Na+ symporter